MLHRHLHPARQQEVGHRDNAQQEEIGSAAFIIEIIRKQGDKQQACRSPFLQKQIHQAESEKKKQEEKRKYPEILQKITLYLEAGLTVRAAVNKIAEDYEQTRKKGAKEQAAYEELLIAVREIRMGVSEGAAYEKFGKRTGVREYIRLSTFLTQNVKKGSTMLLQQLREEAKEAEEMRMRNARKLCEEASTKLLLPMIMLLLVVMILIMFPAFSNVGV